MKVAALVLAAGASRRALGANKLIARDAAGSCMIARSVGLALRSRAERIIVVLGHEADAIRSALDGAIQGGDSRLVLTEARDHAAGLSRSLAQGIACTAEAGADAALVCLGDMPLVHTSTLDRLIDQMHANATVPACVPTSHGRRGNPVLWRSTEFGALLAITGDQGARRLIDQLGTKVLEVATDDPGILQDFDTPTALASYASTSEETHTQ